MQTFPFTPSTVSAPLFKPTLDGVIYACTVTWNLSGQRYFINVSTLQGVAIVSLALVASPPAAEIETATYDAVRGVATLAMSAPHGVRVGNTVARAVDGCVPSDYDGAVTMLATGSTTLDYVPVSVPIGDAISVGTVTAGTNLLAGYFASTMIFRGNAFEVNP